MSGSVDSSPRGPWPLAGRSGELRLLGALLSRADARGLVLAGPAGVGKTRLAVECLTRAEEMGLPTAQASASRAASQLPFGAMAPLLPAAASDSAAARGDLLRRFAAALSERAGERRLVLLVDDAHLLDDASATLVHQLASAGTTLLLATVRTGERAPDPVLALWKDGLLERLELDGLDGLAIGELLTEALGGPVDPGAVARLAARCRGNALYLRELVMGALQTGALADDGGLWRLRRPLEASGRLVELIEARLGEFDDEDRTLLEAVALGEPLSSAELAAVADLRAAERLERAGLLASRLDGRRLAFHLAHPLHGEVLRQRLSGLRQRMTTAALADALAATGARREGDRLRLATWRLEAGGGPPDLMLDAALEARRRFDYPHAERLARAALQDGAGQPAAVLAAQLASLRGRGAEAEAELAALAERAEHDEQVGRVAVARLENLRLMGRLGDAVAVAEAATARLGPSAWRDELAARRAGLLLDLEGPAAGADAAEAVCATASGRALGRACLVAAMALGGLGRLDAALQATERGRAAYEAATDQPPEWPMALLALAGATALAHAGRLEEAHGLAAGEHERAAADGAVDVQGYAALRLAQILLIQGRAGGAARHGREAAALLRELGRRPLLRECLSCLAVAEAVLGRAEAAAAALADLDALGPAEGWAGPDPACARAWLAAAGGDLPAARGLLEAAAERAGAAGDRMGAASALHDLARLGLAGGAPRELRELASEGKGELGAARAAHAAALAGRDPAALDRVSAAFEAMGTWLFAAESAADAAVAWRRAGDERRAAAASRRAAQLAERCEGAATPALRSIESRGLLTPAERQVALLAAAGRSNREIAAALTLSLRTVENRLHRIYEKLGVAGRAELAAALEG